MKVAVDARALVSQPTGMGAYLEGLLAAWSGEVPNDSFVLLSSRPIHVPRALKERVEVCPTKGRVPGTLWLQSLAPRAAERAGADLFFGPLGILPLRSALPGVATVHDMTPLLHPEWHSLRNRLGFGPFLGPTVRRARGLVAVSEATRRDLVRRLPEAAAKCTVVHNGTAALNAGPEPLGPPPLDGRPYVVYVGTLEPRKNLDGLLTALESIWDRRPSFPDLVLAGEKGWGLALFRKRLTTSRHASRVHSLGYKSSEDCHELIRHARLLAYPSFYEGFGLPPLDAMALGTVVVTSNSSALPEVVGDAGLLLDPSSTSQLAAALERAETDEEWRKGARARGLERASHFTWKRAARATRAVFEKALE